jgi:outer membrane receptor protein involved in Fe transport
MVIMCGSSLAATSPAFAQAVRVDIPAGPISRAITILAQQTGASIGSAIDFPKIDVPAVHGRMMVSEALARLLRGSGLRAVRLGGGIWRIERSPAPATPIRPRRTETAAPTASAEGDIVVTATKHHEALGTAAIPLAVLSPDMLDALGDAPDSSSVATALNGLSTTNLGPGRNRLFIRGVADSPLDGFGQSSVSVQVDEARLTYDATDPDLKLIDMAQVELLKGPQGPLYGTGALGGVYRLVPAKPDLTRVAGALRGGLSFNQDGDAAGSVDAMINLPLITDRLGIRAIGYRIGQNGWIDTTGGGHDINHGRTSGGRIDLRVRPVGDWTIDLQALSQSSSIADSQYVEGRGTLSRAARLPEPQDTDVTLVSVTASGSLGAARVTMASSVTWQELKATYDASSKAALFGGMVPAAYVDDRHYQVINNEVRVAGSIGAFDWLAGASLLSASTDATGTLSGATAAPILHFHRQVTETAVFGEATWHFGPTLRGTVGVRVFESAIDDERRDRTTDATVNRANLRASPSATLAWQPHQRLLVFARYASALRPGGIDASSRAGQPPTTYEADELQAFDLGLRWSMPGERITLDAGLFASTWAHVQADYLGADGLVSTRNAGDATNSGIDVTIGWRPDAHWSLVAGVLAQHARIDASGAAGTPDDRRLPIAPDITTHAEIAYAVEVGEWRLGVTGRVSYIGDTRLSFDPGLDRESETVALVSTALTAERHGWLVRAGVDNLGNSRADSFAFGNPFSVLATDQHTPVRPRTVSFSVRRNF